MGRKPAAQTPVAPVAPGLEIITPIRGRKPSSPPYILFFNAFSLEIITPIRGRKHVDGLDSSTFISSV